MLVDPIEISIDPILGLRRKATFISLSDFGSQGYKAVDINYRVSFYDVNDNIIQNNRVSSYSVTLRANNETPVDINGQYVLDGNGQLTWDTGLSPNVVFGEYDFLQMAIAAGANVKDMLEAGALRADTYGRFNI